MTVTTNTERKIARRNFALLYAVSLVAGLVVITALWQKFASRPAPSGAPQTNETEAYFMQVDTVLHQKMERLDGLYTGYVKARRSGVDAGLDAVFAARNDMGKLLDSIDQLAAYLNEGPKKAVMNFTAARFRKAVQNRDSLMNGVLVLPKVPAGEAPAGTAQELDALKRLLQEKEAQIAALQQTAAVVPAQSSTAGSGDARLQKLVDDKDRQIAALQTQLRQKEAALQNSGTQSRPAGGDWQQKYTSLKAAYDKVASSEKSLKNAYQTVADDNRRLLLQLQSMRKN